MRTPSKPVTPAETVGALIDHLRSGVIFEDEHGMVGEANPAVCEMWRLSSGPDALVGRSAAEAGRPPDGLFAEPEVVRARFAALATAGRSSFDQELRFVDGRVLELDYVPVQVGDTYGGCFWIYRDATERRRAEEEVRTLNRELEQRVAQRTQELARSNFELESSVRRLSETQEQLIHAGKMAAVGTLVAGLSHELNNPLGIIVGYVQGLLRRLPEQASSRESLVAIERQALRCAHLVRSLLDFSRNRPATREDTAVGPLIERVLELARGQAARRGVELRWVARGPIPTVVACPQEIESALLNLVSNSIDATSAGGSASLTVSAAARGEAPGVEINVTDTGSGVAPALLSRIFDPFFTTKPVGQGTGIGLALTRQIVEGHGGRIEVRTAEGVGTTMRLWLPLRQPAEPAVGAPPRAVAGKDVTARLDTDVKFAGTTTSPFNGARGLS